MSGSTWVSGKASRRGWLSLVGEDVLKSTLKADVADALGTKKDVEEADPVAAIWKAPR